MMKRSQLIKAAEVAIDQGFRQASFHENKQFEC